MVELTRRRALAALGAGAVGTGGYWHATRGDECVDVLDSSWSFDGENWSRPVRGHYSVLAGEGRGVTGSHRVFRLVSLASGRGRPEWVFAEDGAGFGVPTFHDDTVYVGSGLDRVYALDADTGRIEWKYDAGGDEEYGGGAWGQPALTRGLVVVGISHSDRPEPLPTNPDAYVHRVVALDASDGSEVWSYEVDRGLWTGPVAVGDTVVAATKGGVAYGLGIESGERRWSTSVGGEVREPLVNADGSVFAASLDGRVTALDVESGAEEWTVHTPTATTAFESGDDALFVGTDSGRILSLDRSSDETHWQYEVAASVAAVAIAESRAFVLDQRGVVHALTVADGDRVGQFRVGGHVSDGMCGWNPKNRRARGLQVVGKELLVTGPSIGRYLLPEEFTR